MATFFAGMMAFCDVDIIAAEENVVTETTTETAIISTTEEVTTEQNQSEQFQRNIKKIKLQAEGKGQNQKKDIIRKKRLLKKTLIPKMKS